jgi:aryl-alcohol dehydrogenase-like predicted oxidoreductase
VPLAKGFLSGNYRPGTLFSGKDTRSSYSQAFNDEQLSLVETIKAREVPAGLNMAQWALAWCLRSPVVSSVVVGCKTLAQLESNAAAAEQIS